MFYCLLFSNLILALVVVILMNREEIPWIWGIVIYSIYKEMLIISGRAGIAQSLNAPHALGGTIQSRGRLGVGVGVNNHMGLIHTLSHTQHRCSVVGVM